MSSGVIGGASVASSGLASGPRASKNRALHRARRVRPRNHRTGHRLGERGEEQRVPRQRALDDDGAFGAGEVEAGFPRSAPYRGWRPALRIPGSRPAALSTAAPFRAQRPRCLPNGPVPGANVGSAMTRSRTTALDLGARRQRGSAGNRLELAPGHETRRRQPHGRRHRRWRGNRARDRDRRGCRPARAPPSTYPSTGPRRVAAATEDAAADWHWNHGCRRSRVSSATGRWPARSPAGSRRRRPTASPAARSACPTSRPRASPE